MAGKSLGTLTLDLIANVGGFVAGMDQAERASEKWRKKVKQSAEESGKALAAAGAAAVAAATAFAGASVALVKSTSDHINETNNWAKSLNISTQNLLAWQYAAKQVGLEGDKIGDMFKDLNDKIGDATLNKSGEAVQALDQLGLSAKKLQQQSPDKILLNIAEALNNPKFTQSQRTTILEQLFNDGVRLWPILKDNGAALKQLLAQAQNYGLAPNQQSIDDLLRVNAVFTDIESQISGLKITAASALSGINLAPVQTSLDKIKDVLTDPQVAQGLINLVAQLGDAAAWLIKAAAAAGKIAHDVGVRHAARTGDVDLTNNDQITARIAALEKDRDEQTDLTKRIWSFADPNHSQKVNAELFKLYHAKNVNDQAQKQRDDQINSLLNIPQVGSGSGSGVDVGLHGGTNGKAKASPNAAAYQSALTAYQKQIDLIDTTADKSSKATEVQKLQFETTTGSLKKLTDQQKAHLLGLAQQVDALNKLKKANEDNAKVAEYVANLNAKNDNAQASLNVDFEGAGLGDTARDRLKERLSIQRDFIDQQRDLDKQQASGDIDQSVYERETKALSDALKQRLKINDDYYQHVDELQADWLSGASDGYNNWLKGLSDVSATVATGAESALSGAFDNLTSMLEGNKVSWKSWAVSVLEMIEKVITQMLIVQALGNGKGSSGWLGSLIGSAVGAVTGSVTGGSTPNAAYESAANNLQFNAKGGAYNSSDLSRFSGSIVSSPTLFAFAKGAGLMGEAGPEAVMPLTRAADGSLGVRATGIGNVSGSGSAAPQVYINIDSNGNTDTQSTQGYEQFGREMGAFADQSYKRNLARDLRPGGNIWNAINGGR